PGRVGNLAEKIFSFVSVNDAAVFDGTGAEVGIAGHRVHEVGGHAHRVVGVLGEDGAIGIGVGMRTAVSHCYYRARFGIFFVLAFYEEHDVRMVNIKDDYLGRAAGLAARLDDAGESVESFHEAERTAGRASATEALGGGTQRRKIGSRPRAP